MSKERNLSPQQYKPMPSVLIVSEERTVERTDSKGNIISGDFAELLANELRDTFTVLPIVRNGMDIWSALFDGVPDIIIISHTLRDCDAVSIVNNLRLSPNFQDTFFVLSCMAKNDSVSNICRQNNIGCIVSDDEPLIDSAKTITNAYNDFASEKDSRRLMRLSEFIGNSMYFSDPALRSGIMKNITETVLVPLGLDDRLRGTKYLHLIICLRVIGAEENLKTLYAYTASTYRTSGAAVEKAVRYAIEHAWEKGRPYMQFYLFGNTVDESKGKPTNAEFVATTARHVKEQLRIV